MTNYITLIVLLVEDYLVHWHQQCVTLHYVSKCMSCGHNSGEHVVLIRTYDKIHVIKHNPPIFIYVYIYIYIIYIYIYIYMYVYMYIYVFLLWAISILFFRENLAWRFLEISTKNVILIFVIQPWWLMLLMQNWKYIHF